MGWDWWDQENYWTEVAEIEAARRSAPLPTPMPDTTNTDQDRSESNDND